MIPAHLQNRSIDQLRSTQETIRCFLVNVTGEGYESVITTEKGQCVGGFDYHRSERIIRRFPLLVDDTYPDSWVSRDQNVTLALPYCIRCGNHEFSREAIERSSGSKGRVWENADTGERADNLNDFGPGAMWFLTWYKNENGRYTYTGDVPPLCVRTPGGDWVIDGRASNCTMPDDDKHKCWPRRGDAPRITVDKSLGNTCGAGGGSILHGGYHGFLRDGYLVKC